MTSQRWKTMTTTSVVVSRRVAVSKLADLVCTTLWSANRSTRGRPRALSRRSSTYGRNSTLSATAPMNWLRTWPDGSSRSTQIDADSSLRNSASCSNGTSCATNFPSRYTRLRTVSGRSDTEPPSVSVTTLLRYRLCPHAPIAQLVELRTFNPQVPGSSPGGGTAHERPSAASTARPSVSRCDPHVRRPDPLA